MIQKNYVFKREELSLNLCALEIEYQRLIEVTVEKYLLKSYFLIAF